MSVNRTAARSAVLGQRLFRAQMLLVALIATTTLASAQTTTTLGASTTTTLPGGTTTTIVTASTTTTTLGGSTGSLTTSDGTSTSGLTGSGVFTLVIGGADESAHQASIKVPAVHVLLPPVVGPQVTACLAASGDGVGVIDCDGIDPGGDLHVTRYHVSDATPVQRIDADGTFAAGGLRLGIPVMVSFSVNPGADHHFCTGDDTYTAQGIASTLWLTTGSVEIDIVDADGTPGATLTVSDMGAPFNCGALQAGVMAGAELVGGLPLLDVPESTGPRDMIVSLRLLPQGLQPCQLPCSTDVDCNDGNPCNGVETCVNGLCQAGTPIDCSSGDPCIIDGCDPATGLCTHTPCGGGNLCVVATCSASTGCVQTPVDCSGSNACVQVNGVPAYVTAACDPTTGSCVGGTPVTCDDGNPCTDDSCDPTQGCVHTPNTLPCDDGNGCTTGDACQGGSCEGTPVNCDDGNVCNGFETCDPATGACLPGVPPNCDDGNPCTTDTCDPTLGCVYVNNTAPCDDGNPCTTGDTCAGGTCAGVPVVCSDGNACNGIETCDPTTGVCLPGTPVNCDDGNPCTLDTCNPLDGSCTHTPIPLCQAQALVAQGQALAALVATANPADLGGPRQKTQFQSTLQAINRQLARALAHRAHRVRRLRAVYRRLGRFQLALRRGMSRGRVDVGLANDLTDQAGSLMAAVQEFIGLSGGP